MKRTIRYGLLIGAVAIAGMGMAGAGIQKPAAKPQAGYQAGGHGHGRAGQRFLSEYDLNHDGKVTRDEFNKVTAVRFAEATHGAKTMNAAQYEGFRTKNLHQHADQSFRRADWNGDGKLSFDEFSNPIRASFERADKQSAGVIFCRAQKGGKAAAPQPGHRRRAGSRGAGSFCSRDDLNHDGKVTRAELDQALHQQFAAAAKGGALNKDQFTGMQSTRAQQTSGRTFQRLDADHNGQLTLAEFSATQQRTFERMDKNGDGVIARDELQSSRRSYVRNGSGGRSY
jgi:Ca2+-binding EF-hand superfamily protein